MPPSRKRTLALAPADSTRPSVRRLLADLDKLSERELGLPPLFQSVLDSMARTLIPSGPGQGRAPKFPLQGSLLYYAILCQSLLRLATDCDDLSSIPWVHPEHCLPLEWLQSHAPRAAVLDSEIRDWWTTRTDTLPVDHLQPVYETLIPPVARRRLGEFYTPAWLADYVVSELWEPAAIWLDPTVGSGAFPLALARKAMQEGAATPEFLGIESNPWAALAAAANCAVAAAQAADRGLAHQDLAHQDLAHQDFQIPILCFDVARTPVPRRLSHHFSRVIGNPPWVLWDRLSEEYRRATTELWRDYGLLAESGMASILGGGKKDLAMLVTYVAADRYLCSGGRLGFVITQSVFKSTGSARGFRRWMLPDQTPLGVTRVDDLSAASPFPGVGTKAATLFVKKGEITQYPVLYRSWETSSADPSLAPIIVEQEAFPASSDDPLSAWLHQPKSAACSGVLGRSDYVARLGANTGGANGIYWLDQVETISKEHWRMRNLAGRGKRQLPILETLLESRLLYPLLMGKDVRAWQAVPNAWILLVQDPFRRRGFDPEELKAAAPRALNYLTSFEVELRQRAAFLRYFTRLQNQRRTETGPFYSMFNIGPSILSPWKVVWNRMGHKLAAAVVGMLDDKPIIPQETHCFFEAASEDEAHYLAALLNSPQAQAGLEKVGQVGGKSFATPSSIHRLALRKYDPAVSLHRELSALGAAARMAQGNGKTWEGACCLSSLVERYWDGSGASVLANGQGLHIVS